MTFALQQETQKLGRILRASLSIRQIGTQEQPILPPGIAIWEFVYIWLAVLLSMHEGRKLAL